MAELGVAVFGAGRMAGFHVDTRERLDRACLIALAGPDQEVARARGGRHPIELMAISAARA